MSYFAVSGAIDARKSEGMSVISDSFDSSMKLRETALQEKQARMQRTGAWIQLGGSVIMLAAAILCMF